MRQLDAMDLWVQRRARSGDFDLYKIPGERNPGDLFTKFCLSQERIQLLVHLLGGEFRGGRAGSALAVRTDGRVMSLEVDENEGAHLVQKGKHEEKGTGKEVAALLVQQRAQYVTAHGVRGSTECVSAFCSPDHKTSVSGRSSGADFRQSHKSASGLVSGNPNELLICGAGQRIPESNCSNPTRCQVPHSHKCARLRKLFWADLDHEEAMSTAEVSLLLAVLGLPHLVDSNGREHVVMDEAWPEYPEASDPLFDHGLNIARLNAGRHGVPLRLGPRLADPCRGGALGSGDKVCIIKLVLARRVQLIASHTQNKKDFRQMPPLTPSGGSRFYHGGPRPTASREAFESLRKRTAAW